MKKIAVIIGARPQFIKHAPVEIALKKYFQVFSIHTGQHYDARMSDIFFEQLNIERPKYMLNVGSGNHGKQTADMLEKIEEILLDEQPDLLLVYGDTNSTIAGALAAAKISIPIIHIEAGLRSFNKAMPEEINRIVTDHLSEMLFAPTEEAVKNLLNEGLQDRIYKSGDVMCDMIHLAKEVLNINDSDAQHILVTLHRPYNTDSIDRLLDILNNLQSLEQKIIFPIHPRTANILKSHNVDLAQFSNINFIDPVSYFDLVKLQMQSSAIITDSGGIQKEAYILKKKCITLRSETEWVETLEGGWNHLVFENLGEIANVLKLSPQNHNENLYGNGKAADEIAKAIYNHVS